MNVVYSHTMTHIPNFFMWKRKSERGNNKSKR